MQQKFEIGYKCTIYYTHYTHVSEYTHVYTRMIFIYIWYTCCTFFELRIDMIFFYFIHGYFKMEMLLSFFLYHPYGYLILCESISMHPHIRVIKVNAILNRSAISLDLVFIYICIYICNVECDFPTQMCTLALCWATTLTIMLMRPLSLPRAFMRNVFDTCRASRRLGFDANSFSTNICWHKSHSHIGCQLTSEKFSKI